ncbi:MAG: hypothetical protein M1607_02555 [Patescibacteria group bacterium]|nr:hypothetical protein [Patescibacteria group bacterium]
MLKLRGLYLYFPVLDKLKADRVMLWLDKKTDLTLSENRLGNRLLYPQTIPVTPEEMAFDLALLRELIALQPDHYLNRNLRRLIVPENLLDRFPNLSQVCWAMVDAFQPLGVSTVYLRSERLGLKSIGTVIKPEKVNSDGIVKLWVAEKSYQLKVGSLFAIPVNAHRVDVGFESTAISLMGKSNNTTQVIGGDLGLLIDLRKPLKKETES